jgi:hypothetical protein
MREINNVQHTVDQRQAEGDKRVNCASQQTVEDRRDQNG